MLEPHTCLLPHSTLLFCIAIVVAGIIEPGGQR